MVHYKNYKMRNLSIVLAVLVAIPFTVLAQNQSECYNTVTFCPIGKRLGFTRTSPNNVEKNIGFIDLATEILEKPLVL